MQSATESQRTGLQGEAAAQAGRNNPSSTPSLIYGAPGQLAQAFSSWPPITLQLLPSEHCQAKQGSQAQIGSLTDRSVHRQADRALLYTPHQSSKGETDSWPQHKHADPQARRRALTHSRAHTQQVVPGLPSINAVPARAQAWVREDSVES